MIFIIHYSLFILGVFIVAVLVLLGLFLLLVFLLLLPVMIGAPYVPTPDEKIARMIRLARIKPGEKALDIGSGDGRIVVALAKEGAKAYGYEVNPLLVYWSRRKLRKAGLAKQTVVCWKNFWSQDLGNFDVVTLYGVGHIMKSLEKKLKRELKPGSRVISNSFVFPTWKPVRKIKNVRLYVVPKSRV